MKLAVSDAGIAKIRHLTDLGYAPRSIANVLGMNHGTVEKIVGQYLLERGQAPVSGSVSSSSFIAPPPLSRLMAGR